MTQATKDKILKILKWLGAAVALATTFVGGMAVSGCAGTGAGRLAQKTGAAEYFIYADLDGDGKGEKYKSSSDGESPEFDAALAVATAKNASVAASASAAAEIGPEASEKTGNMTDLLPYGLGGLATLVLGGAAVLARRKLSDVKNPKKS